MTRSVTFTVPSSPRAIIQRVGGTTTVTIRLEDAWELVNRLVEDLEKAKFEDKLQGHPTPA